MDRIYETFLEAQFEAGMALARDSDLLELIPVSEGACPRYVARFFCTGLVKNVDGEIVEANRFDVGIWLPPDYLRFADPLRVVTWLGPRSIFHPNISATLPMICLGRLTPGTALTDLLLQAFEIITFKKITMSEHDALNFEACAWARKHPHRFPVDSRSLKRSSIEFFAEEGDQDVRGVRDARGAER